MIRHGLWRRKAARCMGFVLALSLVFPGTVYAAAAADGEPYGQVYDVSQDPLDGITDENEAMEAAASGQSDDFGVLTEEETAADALSAEEGTEEYEIPEGDGEALAGEEGLFPEDGTEETGDGAILSEDEFTGTETDGSLPEADKDPTASAAVLPVDEGAGTDGSEAMTGEEAGENEDGETAMEAGEETEGETDTETGEETDGETSEEIDGETGEEIDGETGEEIDGETGEEIDGEDGRRYRRRCRRRRR